MTKPEDSNLASLDRVIEEILVRLRADATPSLTDFVGRYPEHESAIRDIFPALRMAEKIKQDSLVGNSSLKSPPPIRSTEHHLLLGVLALQCGLINREQFLSSFEKWNSDRSRSYQSVLLSENMIKNEACEFLNLLVDQHLAGMVAVDQAPLGGDQTHVFMGGTKSHSHDNETEFSLSESATPSNRFEFIRPLDQGGLGIVSVALDKELNREVALKEIREDRANDSQLRERFWLEAQLTGGLEHPGIIPIYGLGKSAKGKLYYAMRLIKGNNLHLHIKSFHEKVKQGKTEFDGQSLRRMLRRFLDVCEAISYAHSRGVLHRDLKPGNIMLGPYGETLVVDWGLAKAMGISAAAETQVSQDVSVLAQPETPIRRSGSRSDSTRDGSIVGTPSYAPPEQLSGHLDLIEVRSDVYGLGAILYELLCGQAPASGSLLEVVRMVTTGKVPTVRSVNAQVPKTLEAICCKAMALAPSDRYDSASELRSEVERWLDDAPVLAYAEPIWTRCSRWLRKHPAMVSTLSSVVIMLLAGTALFATIVSQNNSKLGKLNSELLDSIQREKLSAELANEKSQLARSQSQLALSTLNSVLLNVQASLRTLPGGSSVRRAIITASLASLDKVVTEVADKSMAERSTMIALIELADVAVQIGTGNQSAGIGKLEATRNSVAKYNTDESKSAAKIASSSLSMALEIGNQLYQETKSNEIGYDLYRIYFALAYNKVRLGDSEEAILLFGKALAIGQELIAKDPENRKFRGQVARAKTALSDILRKSSRLDLAAKWIRESLSETKTLSGLDPNNPWFGELHAESLECMGEVQVAEGDLKSADESYLESAEIRKQLLKQDNANLGKMKALIYALGKRTTNLLTLGQLAKADQAEEEVAQLHRKIQMIDPIDSQSRFELANSLERRAKIIAKQGDIGESIQLHKQAMEIRQRLADEDPSDMLRKRALSVSCDNLGKAELKQGNFIIAKELLVRSLTTSREMALDDPKNAIKQKDVGLSLVSVGSILLKEGSPSEATPFYKESLDIFERLAQDDLTNAVKQRDLMIARARLAEVYLNSKQLDSALELYQKSIQSVRDRLAAKPNDAETKQDLSTLLQNIGEVHIQRDLPAEALTCFTEGVEIQAEVLKLDPTNTSAKMDLAVAILRAGIALKRLNRFEDAIAKFDQTIEYIAPLTSIETGDLNSVATLAEARFYLGEIQFQQGKMETAAELLMASQKAIDRLFATTSTNAEWRTLWVDVSIVHAKLEAATGKESDHRKRSDDVSRVLKDLIKTGVDAAWAEKKMKEISSAKSD